jgi:hypothetical protein
MDDSSKATEKKDIVRFEVNCSRGNSYIDIVGQTPTKTGELYFLACQFNVTAEFAARDEEQ